MTDTMTALRQHTLASIAADADTTKRTVQRWLEKAMKAELGEIGVIDGDTRCFSDSELDILLSYQSKRPAKSEVIEAELMPEPGAITLSNSSQQATGLMRFDIEPLELSAPTADLEALQRQTEQLEQTAQQGANAIAAYFGARFDVGLANIAAKQDNLLKGIEAQALNGAARSMANSQAKPGKPR